MLTNTRSATSPAARTAAVIDSVSSPLAMPGRFGPASQSAAGTTPPNPSTAMRHPLRSTTAAVEASRTVAPAPTGAMPLPRSRSTESSSAAGPKSPLWLFARFATSTPAAFAAGRAPGSHRKLNSFGTMAPRSETGHSRFTTVRSSPVNRPSSPAQACA